jgi:hypothetical protein
MVYRPNEKHQLLQNLSFRDLDTWKRTKQFFWVDFYDPSEDDIAAVSKVSVSLPQEQEMGCVSQHATLCRFSS